MYRSFRICFYILLASILFVACQTKSNNNNPNPNPPGNQLPTPLPNVSLNNRTFTGATQMTGTFQGAAIPAQEIEGTVTLSEANDGSLTGELSYRVSEVGKPKPDGFFVVPIAGENDAGKISAPISIPDECGGTIAFTLEGTINPEYTLNFAAANATSNCMGSTNLSIPAWKLEEPVENLNQISLAYDPTDAVIATEKRPADEMKVED